MPDSRQHEILLLQVQSAYVLVTNIKTDRIWLGRSVLLVEGRDRVGGRTYTVDEDGTATFVPLTVEC